MHISTSHLSIHPVDQVSQNLKAYIHEIRSSILLPSRKFYHRLRVQDLPSANKQIRVDSQRIIFRTNRLESPQICSWIALKDSLSLPSIIHVEVRSAVRHLGQQGVDIGSDGVRSIFDCGIVI